MDKHQIKTLLKQTEVFSDFSAEDLEKIAVSSHCKHLDNGELLIRQHSSSHCIYLIVQGVFSVYGNVTQEKGSIRTKFNELTAGDTVGEFSFLDELPRSADIIAEQDDCEVIEIHNDMLAEIAPTSFYRKIAKKLSQNIRSGNEKLIQHLLQDLDKSKKIANMGRFIVYVLLLLSFYILALNSFITLATHPYISMFASTSVIGIFTIVLLIMIRQMGYPYKLYGLTMKNWQSSIKDALIYTTLALIAITLLKWWLISHSPALYGNSIIDMKRVVPQAKAGSFAYYAWFISGLSVYSLFSIFQEFISRGILQTSLQLFLEGKHKNLLANFVTSGVFSAMHIHLSSRLALIVFLPSMLWGWLYSKNGSLLAPVISHLLFGIWAIFFLGMQELLIA